MSKPCLIIIFNHRFDKNIPVLEKIYSGRFSNIFFLVPFYNGDKENVIPVYESSHFFQSFLAQGYNRFAKDEFTHYIFTGDDCLLNPALNENNFLELMGLDADSDFIPEFIELHTLTTGWWQAKKGIDFFHNRPGAEVKNELPSREEAVAKFNRHGLSVQPLSTLNIFGKKKVQFLNRWQSFLYKQFYLHVKWKKYRKNGKVELPYPVVGSYSDMFIINKTSIKEFCRVCGITASVGLFVELAIPTALVLVSEKITLEKQLRLQGLAMWQNEETAALESTHKNSLSALLNNFPSKQLYYHPVKLSKWKNDL